MAQIAVVSGSGAVESFLDTTLPAVFMPPSFQHNSFFFQRKQKMIVSKQDSQPQHASLNPLSPNSDQHQFSPNDIHTLSRD